MLMFIHYIIPGIGYIILLCATTSQRGSTWNTTTTKSGVITIMGDMTYHYHERERRILLLRGGGGGEAKKGDHKPIERRRTEALPPAYGIRYTAYGTQGRQAGPTTAEEENTIVSLRLLLSRLPFACFYSRRRVHSPSALPITSSTTQAHNNQYTLLAVCVSVPKKRYTNTLKTLVSFVCFLCCLCLLACLPLRWRRGTAAPVACRQR